MKRTAAPADTGHKRTKTAGYDEKTDQIIVPKFKWYDELNALLAQPPDTDTIIWVVDRVGGNTGKTVFVRKYERAHPDVAKRLPSTLPPSSLIRFLEADKNIMFFDVPCAGKFKAYGVLRQIKEGSVINKKITFGATHVVIMSHKEPEHDKLVWAHLKVVEATREVHDE
jgi:hypothetical protein